MAVLLNSRQTLAYHFSIHCLPVLQIQFLPPDFHHQQITNQKKKLMCINLLRVLFAFFPLLPFLVPYPDLLRQLAAELAAELQLAAELAAELALLKGIKRENIYFYIYTKH